LSQAQPSPKQLNFNSLAMQGNSKLVAVRRRKIRVFEVERVYISATGATAVATIGIVAASKTYSCVKNCVSRIASKPLPLKMG